VTRTRPEHADELTGVLALAAAGDPAACDRVFAWLADPVAGYLRARGAEDPEDLTNEVFLRVFRTLAGFRGDLDGFRAWVFTIARNCLIDEQRRAARRPSVVLFESVPDVLCGPDAETLVLARLAEERVAALLGRLSPDQHHVLVLRVVADLSVEQTASVLGKTSEAVKALTRRGLAALQREIHRGGVSL
jgi:RNA polymerase sigma-70 factor (ECF subfamily)